MTSSRRFMITFGDVSGDPPSLKKWTSSWEKVMYSEAWKATGYDRCAMEGMDWGWVSSSTQNGDFNKAAELLFSYGFSLCRTRWGESKFFPGPSLDGWTSLGGVAQSDNEVVVEPFSEKET
ncbi:hypothetical protein BDP55DRAFT_720479 [Colletotrichum godetiae]|uniref:Uncharacterized protein n=1 Tax=Colletotrichum godetiae TaxID=1209918 RepID=A0AAJ0A8W3_9PEZI|nr:uncharacterized protein BDP55DRAFT_720479 [Colletotrichum godetiae]KAK1658686.1 hypothetical protein BDP55DRAFT_720479 [Colletotrichum godetiae]